MTIYFPDISGWNGNIDLARAAVVEAKVTEGTYYFSNYYAAQKAEAARHGAFFIAYHFLIAGNAEAQARFCHDRTGATPLMLDVETLGSSLPGVADMVTFIDAYRRFGGHCNLLYLPHWYWQTIGSPSLKPLVDRHVNLISSAYTSYTDASSGVGWQAYGGMEPKVWQYTDRLKYNGQAVDFNAFRGSYAGKQDAASVRACLEQFKALAIGSKPPPPVKHAQGIRRFIVTVNANPPHGHNWDVRPDTANPGNFQAGSIDHWASAEIQFNTKTELVRMRGMPFDSPPLGR